jgi:DNA-binding CsgD family transcriptional regulator
MNAQCGAIQWTIPTLKGGLSALPGGGLSAWRAAPPIHAAAFPRVPVRPELQHGIAEDNAASRPAWTHYPAHLRSIHPPNGGSARTVEPAEGAVASGNGPSHRIFRCCDALSRFDLKMDAHGLKSLTKSEENVARLVAQGLTNREVARHLSLSTHTVNTHLRNSFAKLGISRRVELVRLVLAMDSRTVPPET